jgi:hypothetical protein
VLLDDAISTSPPRAKKKYCRVLQSTLHIGDLGGLIRSEKVQGSVSTGTIVARTHDRYLEGLLAWGPASALALIYIYTYLFGADQQQSGCWLQRPTQQPSSRSPSSPSFMIALVCRSSPPCRVDDESSTSRCVMICIALFIRTKDELGFPTIEPGGARKRTQAGTCKGHSKSVLFSRFCWQGRPIPSFFALQQPGEMRPSSSPALSRLLRYGSAKDYLDKRQIRATTVMWS